MVYVIVAVLCLKMLWSSLRTQDMNHVISPVVKSFHGKTCVKVDGECVYSGDISDPSELQMGLNAYNNSFYLDGRPFRILSGSFHYFRTLPSQWKDRFLMMRAAGLNTVTTYVAWNVHEKTPNDFRFTGRYDIVKFVKQASQAGLHVIIRAGPYICAEWEFGGLPAWLLNDPNMKVRSSQSAGYLKAVENYMSKLLPMLAKYTHKRGGPIIAFQLENEFGSLKTLDREYLTFLLLLHQKSGIDELFFTSDGAEFLPFGTLPGVLATVNFAKNPETHLNALKKFQPDKPLMVTEFWSGWFDHWGEDHHVFDPYDLTERLEVILSYNASVNFYMFVGGTNFGFYNGANHMKSGYEATVTSYDYNAPVSECGDVTPKYRAIRDSLIKHKLLNHLPPIPANPPKRAYGTVKMTHAAEYTSLVSQIPKKNIFVSDDIYPMESLKINNGQGHGYGFILYRCLFNYGTKLKIDGEIYDRALMFINESPVGEVKENVNVAEEIDAQQLVVEYNSKDNVLDILVENMGRVNFKAPVNPADIFEKQRKGLIDATVSLDEDELTVIQHIPLDFSPELFSNSSLWFALDYLPHLPSAYRAKFSIHGQVADTFLDMSQWIKGVVFINGFNIGRYWKRGPQRTLYVPFSLLHEGTNEIIVFELYDLERSQAVVEFLAEPWLQ